MRGRKSPVAAATAIGAEAEIDPVTIPEQGGERQDKSPLLGPFATHAEILWRAGLIPIPLTGEGDGKSPLVRGFTSWKKRPSLDAVAKWAQSWPEGNLGIVTGYGLTVIDIDDPAVIHAVIARFGPTPLQVTTPSGGLHLYYASSGERCGTLRPSLPVDIKGLGGYVVAPPSIRPSGEFGRQYEIVRGSWEDLSTLPPLRSGSVPGLASESGETPTPLRAL
jgi:hypothetical protein